ncbi:hypothetical protein I317_07465 [Kwoniella heveanensis CBS 569]|nr:hypothetical protein I317_07465 [Kwoniella heveanensis CBS 569]
MTTSADTTVSLPLPTVCTPSLKPVPDSRCEQDMDHLRFIQPFDPSRYQSPSLPFPMDLDDDLHAPEITRQHQSSLLQLSHDRSNLDHSPLTLPTRPASFKPSPSPSQYPTPELPQRHLGLHDIFQTQYQTRQSLENPPQASQSLDQSDSKTPLCRAPGLEPQSSIGGWPKKAYTPQLYEPPYQPSNLAPNYGSGHSHSHSTPAFTPYASFETPYQSHSTLPNQHAHSYSYSYSHPEPAPAPLQASSLPDGYKMPQPHYWSHSHPPSLRWKSQSPYQQPAYNSFGSDRRAEDEKRRERLIKARRHVCPVCDKRFNRPSSLNTHMAVHTGAKHCGRRFSVSSNLRRHERTHDTRAARQRQLGIETINRISQPGATPMYDDAPQAHDIYEFPPQTHYQPQAFSPPLCYTYYQPYATPSQASVPYPTPSSTACSGTDTTSSLNTNGQQTTKASTNNSTDSGLAQYQVVTKPRRVMELGLDRFEFPRRPAVIGHGHGEHGQGHAHTASFGSASMEMDVKAEMLLS